jgi:hypothetical protein
MKNTLADFYLNYLNDFLTIERFAEYHDMSVNAAEVLLSIGRKFHIERTEG